MQSASNFFSQSQPKSQIRSVNTLILFKTKNETLVLCQKENGQQIAGICASLSKTDGCRPYKKILSAIVQNKILLDTDVKENEPGFRSMKIARKVLSSIEKNKEADNIHVQDHDNLTIITSINCKHEDILKIQKALNNIGNLKNEKHEFYFDSLETLIASDEKVRALNGKGVLNKYRNTFSTEILPTEICLLIFINLENKDILSFLLSSKYLSSMLDNKNLIWKTLISPTISQESNKFLLNDNYKQIFLKRTLMNYESFDSKSKFTYDIDLSGPITSFVRSNYSLFEFCLRSSKYLCFKEINPNKVNQYIIEDNDIELFHEVSRLADFFPHILINYKKDDAFKLIKHIDTELISKHEERLQHGDFVFINLILPYIIDAHAEKCFELFIKTYHYFLCLLGLNDYSCRSSFADTINIVFDSNNEYFKYLLITLTLKYGNTYLMLKIINACHERRLILLDKALNEIDLTEQRYEPILPLLQIVDKDEKIEADYNHEKIINLLKCKISSLCENDISLEELQTSSDEIKQLLDALVKARINQENGISQDKRIEDSEAQLPSSEYQAFKARF